MTPLTEAVANFRELGEVYVPNKWLLKIEKIAKKIDPNSQTHGELDGSYASRFADKKMAKAFVKKAGKQISFKKYWVPIGGKFAEASYHDPKYAPVSPDEIAKGAGYGKKGDHRSFWA